jgi:hypothetical protein
MGARGWIDRGFGCRLGRTLEPGGPRGRVVVGTNGIDIVYYNVVFTEFKNIFILIT